MNATMEHTCSMPTLPIGENSHIAPAAGRRRNADTGTGPEARLV